MPSIEIDVSAIFVASTVIRARSEILTCKLQSRLGPKKKTNGDSRVEVISFGLRRIMNINGIATPGNCQGNNAQRFHGGLTPYQNTSILSRRASLQADCSAHVHVIAVVRMRGKSATEWWGTENRFRHKAYARNCGFPSRVTANGPNYDHDHKEAYAPRDRTVLQNRRAVNGVNCPSAETKTSQNSERVRVRGNAVFECVIVVVDSATRSHLRRNNVKAQRSALSLGCDRSCDGLGMISAERNTTMLRRE
ncbi:hypothetical protein DFH94DRAFT_849205 [Russula ochroleuca]|uniref:Uncharacterized protein n=1 Tax=Russula ochroleuca TaxID=152965 RepID=A0A9P5MPM2_9AGAM|nr:hypothetical protein DFH94DRAFT_849205 [Russula ochroleuca]